MIRLVAIFALFAFGLMARSYAQADEPAFAVTGRLLYESVRNEVSVLLDSELQDQVSKGDIFIRPPGMTRLRWLI